MVTSLIGTAAEKLQSISSPAPAVLLKPSDRKGAAVQVLARIAPVTHLANAHGVSRKFLYHQAAIASSALDGAFAPTPEDHRVLFHLPVTRDWRRQLALAMVLIGHSSLRAVPPLLPSSPMTARHRYK